MVICYSSDRNVIKSWETCRSTGKITSHLRRLSSSVYAGLCLPPSIYWQGRSPPLWSFWKAANISDLSVVCSLPYLVPPRADFLFCFLIVTQWVWEGWEVFGILLESVTPWWMQNVSRSLIVLKAQPSKMIHEKSSFWYALRLPEAALEYHTGLCETAGRGEQCGLWKWCSFFLQKESWSERAALASEISVSGPQCWPCSHLMWIPASYCFALGTGHCPGSEKERCISPGIFGEGIESWAGLRVSRVLEQPLPSHGLLCPCRQWPYFLFKAHYLITELSSHTFPSSGTFLCFVERSPVSRVLAALAFQREKLYFLP